ncbi:hypothetical protein POM88_009179 [Heracleum sosnowskyi]|uniref:Protein kinase domain-containing protein n=1 Tax=Heracleum sosnowskyi TaxID=360622 RepID=A0AAD8N843_9APIA|nr:hypothetical protein POM88_009179 [Heracleum sosnowskyi]
MPELRLGFRGCSAAPIWSRVFEHMTEARAMTSSSESTHVHYNHTDACQFTRWNARESYHFMYAARSWNKVNDFYSQLVLGNVSFSDIFKTPMHVDHEADLVDTSVQTESTTSPTIKMTGRWARVTFKIVLSYNGGAYDGWQKQPGLNTVQGSVERSLGKFIDAKKLLLLKDKGLPIEGCVVVAGRTDKGVTAYQQVCSFSTWRTDIKAQDIEEAVNDAGPGNLRVISVFKVSRAFHPNFSAKWRRYIYVFPLNTEKEESSQCEDADTDVFDGGKRNVFDDVHMALEDSDVLADNYNTETRNVKKSNSFSVKKVDLLLRQLEGKLLSYKMFARDTKASRNIGPPTECFLFHARATETKFITDAEDQEGAEAMCIELVANRFLRKMVRVLVATAIREAAAGAEDDALLKLMDATCRRATAPPAPADGLCLFDVGSVYICSSSPRERAARTSTCTGGARMIMALITKINNNENRIARPPGLLIVLAILLNLCLTSLSIGPSESEILLEFKASLSNNSALSSWTKSKPPCPTGNWAGVHCVNNNVRALRLHRIGLTGNLKVDILKGLQGLRSISIWGNQLEGGIPDFSVMSALKNVYLSDNKFSGIIKTDTFHGMISLKRLHAARNRFIGPIPDSLALLPKLKELNLENNRFSGQMPDFQQRNWSSFNVSNNQLDGPIPNTLMKLNASSFAGNKNLCGGREMQACPIKDLDSLILTIVYTVVALAAAVAIVSALVIFLRRRREASQLRENGLSTMRPENARLVTSSGYMDLDKMEYGGSSHGKSVHGRKNSNSSRKTTVDSTKLIFLRDDRPSFDLTDLLSASAEILGSGVFGSSYKAAMNDGSSTVMVVKKYAKMKDVPKDEFYEHMRMLGKLNHPNVLPIVAYYYRKEEKLLVSEYVANVSLAVHLHGGGNKLDWGKRLRIVKGVARGLLYLYNQLPSLIAPHGHLKSANVVLNEAWEPLLNDYALSRIVNQEDAQDLMIMYKSPEYRTLNRISKKTDVWSLGSLTLEILTGRFPANILQQIKGVKDNGDLAAWVDVLVREDENWKNKVFDKDMMMNIKAGGEEEQEMHKLLKIGLACCEMEVDKRLDIREAVEQIENVKEPEH